MTVSANYDAHTQHHGAFSCEHILFTDTTQTLLVTYTSSLR